MQAVGESADNVAIAESRKRVRVPPHRHSIPKRAGRYTGKD